MLKHLLAGVALLVSSAVFAGSSVAHLCGQMTAEQNGIRCRVSDIDGLGATLLIKIHVKKSDEATFIAKVQAATRQAIDTFLAEGGVFIKMRTVRQDGVEVERTCSKVKGKKTEHCGEWEPVRG